MLLCQNWMGCYERAARWCGHRRLHLFDTSLKHKVNCLTLPCPYSVGAGEGIVCMEVEVDEGSASSSKDTAQQSDSLKEEV